MKAYEFKITLKGAKPQVWRKIIVPAMITFEQFHDTIQIAMGWQSFHLYKFEFTEPDMRVVKREAGFDNVSYFFCDEPQVNEPAFNDLFGWKDMDDGELKPVTAIIDAYVEQHQTFLYLYDLGDNWQHKIELLAVHNDYPFDYPQVIKANGNCPPEDCGGCWAYGEFLKVLEAPEHPKHQELQEWASRQGYEAYDLEYTNEMMELELVFHQEKEGFETIMLDKNKDLHSQEGVPEQNGIIFEAEQERNQETELDQWKKLYKLTMELKELQPWGYLWDMDLITILLPDLKEPVYCSILGRNGECYGIGIYKGHQVCELMKLVNCKDVPVEQKIRYQNCLMCYFGERKELTKKELNIIKKLGLKFEGSNQWICFQSFQPGYWPNTLAAEEVSFLIKVYEQLLPTLCEYSKGAIKVNFDHQETLVRSYDKGQEKWVCHCGPLQIPEEEHTHLVLEDELLVRRLKKRSMTDQILEMDLVCLGVRIDNKEFKRPIMPILFLMLEKKSGMVIDQDMLCPNDDKRQILIKSLVNFILDQGRPRKIFVRDEDCGRVLWDLCQKLSIEITVSGKLELVDDCMRDMNNMVRK